jgi:branched-subunit amino acid transport protein AzlD
LGAAQEQIMKRITDYLNQQEGVLTAALVFVLVCSALSLLRAIAAGSGVETLIAPIFVSVG